jgi:hypothetical protein
MALSFFVISLIMAAAEASQPAAAAGMALA